MCREDFLNRTLIAQTLRPTIDRWDHTKLKSFYKAKMSPSSEDEVYGMGKIFTSSTSDRGLISRIYKDLKVNK